MHQEDITMINLYTLNNRASVIQEAIKFDPYFIQYLKITSKQIKLKWEAENYETSKRKHWRKSL